MHSLNFRIGHMRSPFSLARKHRPRVSDIERKRSHDDHPAASKVSTTLHTT